jgi:hypothetical protein
VQCAQGSAHTSIQVQPGHSGIPCAMALRLMPCSPRRRIRLASVIGELTAFARPVGLRNASANLTPATGARTTRFCRTRLRRSSAAPPIAHELKARPAIDLAQPALPRPPHSEPNVRDDRDTPLLWAGTGGVIALIWGVREQVYFCEEG